MPTPTSQGSIVTFNGNLLGRLTNWRVQPGTAQFAEWTNVGSTVIGTGIHARVVKQYFCEAIEPGGVTITMFGVPPGTHYTIGQVGTLSVEFDGGGISLEAYVETFDVSASVGEFLVGTASFKFSGTGWTPQ